MKIPFSPPDISEEEINEVADALRSGWITTGPKTKRFEQEIAAWCNTDKAVCLNSSTACMEMTLRLMGIGPGDEVIVPAYTYTATASVVCHVGAKPVIVDVARDSFQMSTDAIEGAINEHTKAIIPVDYAGIMCDYEKIFEIVKKKAHLFTTTNKYHRAIGRILVLADASHAFGATYDGKPCGSVADFSSFSFHAVKNLTTAEGGAVAWRSLGELDEEIYREYMLLSLHGQSKDALAKTKLGAWEYDILSPAYKCNMTDVMASIGLAQLKRYKGMLARRKEIIEMYESGLQGTVVEPLQHFTDRVTSSGHLFITRLRGMDLSQRNEVIEKMAARGVATNVHYKPLPMLTAYKQLGCDIKDYPNAYAMFENELSLPLHTSLSNDQVAFVIESLKEVLTEVN